MEIKRKCEKCGNVVNIGFVQEKDLTSVVGEYLKVKYFACSCGAKNIVQYDNKATEQMVRVSKNILVEQIKKKAKGQTPSLKAKRKMENLNKKIDKARKELNEKYHGKVEIKE